MNATAFRLCTDRLILSGIQLRINHYKEEKQDKTQETYNSSLI